MLARVWSLGLSGIDGYPVHIEADVAGGLPAVDIVGLPDAAVKESKERVRTALRNAGYEFPPGRVTINLAPADVRKEGPIYDLPIALGILTACGHLPQELLEGMAFLGELSLNGEVRGVRGALPMVLAAREAGRNAVALPEANARECACVEGIDILPVRGLRELVLALRRPERPYQPREPWAMTGTLPEDADHDLARIRGQYGAKRALEVAAAGSHNILFIGPPGSGKSMLARTLPTILPSLTFEEALEVTKLYSVSGETERVREGLIRRRQVRAPHHTSTTVAMAGGGTPVRPGDMSLAHCGVLFLDELPEFNRNTLEALRQPLEDGHITIARAAGSATFPARFMLVAAMNPCPCGYYGSTVRQCRCSRSQIASYLGRISGPLLDRFDLQLEVGAVEYGQLVGKAAGEPSSAVRERIVHARDRQTARYHGSRYPVNAAIGPKEVEEHCTLDAAGHALLEQAFRAYGWSARAYTRILKVARTIADLDDADAIADRHLAEAIQYRVLDRKYWGREG